MGPSRGRGCSTALRGGGGSAVSRPSPPCTPSLRAYGDLGGSVGLGRGHKPGRKHTEWAPLALRPQQALCPVTLIRYQPPDTHTHTHAHACTHTCTYTHPMAGRRGEQGPRLLGGSTLSTRPGSAWPHPHTHPRPPQPRRADTRRNRPRILQLKAQPPRSESRGFRPPSAWDDGLLRGAGQAASRVGTTGQ